MHHLDSFYATWHSKLAQMLDEHGASADLAKFLWPGGDTPLQGYRVWVSKIKLGKKRPDGTIMAAIQAWMEARQRTGRPSA